jgi:hypothetical protein
MNTKTKAIARALFELVAAGLMVAAAMMALALRPTPIGASTTPPCDFLTGGGWIVHHGAHANFGVGGGCKHGSPTWGHLEYIDHGTGLNVHGTSITAYLFDNQGTGVDPKTHQPTGTRTICGTARTNLYGDVNFAVRAEDLGEPGVNDQFDIRLTNPITNAPFYDTTTECSFHYLGSFATCAPGDGGGGNIQLHKPDPSTSGTFGGACPANFGGGIIT